MKPLNEYTSGELARMAGLLHDEIEYGLTDSIKEAMRTAYRMLIAESDRRSVTTDETLKRNLRR